MTQLIFGRMLLRNDMRVLVIEDERKVASLVSAGLAEQGFAADLCYDGD